MFYCQAVLFFSAPGRGEPNPLLPSREELNPLLLSPKELNQPLIGLNKKYDFIGHNVKG